MTVNADSGVMSLPILWPVDTFKEKAESLSLDTQEDMIAYDNGPSLYFSFTEVGTKFTVRFTPLMPCTLSYVEIVTYNGSGEALIHVWDDDNGVPGNDLITPFTATLNGDLIYQRIDIEPFIDMGSDDFHVGVEYLQSPPPYMTSDADSVIELRSKYKRPSDPNWQDAVYNICIRAFVRYYVIDHEPPTIVHVWRALGFSEEGDHPLVANISDDSGVDYATIHYSIDEVEYFSIDMVNTENDTWVGAIPAQPIGTTIYYYITAVDTSPDSNEAVFPPTAPDEPYTMEIVEGYELAYDDGLPERFFVVDSLEYHDNACAIRITPDEYPVKIILARAYVLGDSSVYFTINDQSDGVPGDVLPGGGEVVANRLPHGWAIANWEDGALITEGDFFVVMHWQPDAPGNPAVGQDSNTVLYRSFWYSSPYGWNFTNDGEWMMRVVVVTSTGIKEIGSDGVKPAGYELLGNYPNPFNATTDIRFITPYEGDVKIEIFNIKGQLIKTLVDGYIKPGIYSKTWDGSNNSGNEVSSGVYFCKLTAGGNVDTRKMVLMK